MQYEKAYKGSIWYISHLACPLGCLIFIERLSGEFEHKQHAPDAQTLEDVEYPPLSNKVQDSVCVEKIREPGDIPTDFK